MKYVQKILHYPKKKLIIYSLFILLLLFILFSPYGIIRTVEIANELSNLKNEITDIKQTNDSLRKKIKELRYDTLEIEKVAREKYGMVKKGEKVYIFKEED